jgi:hypothetical protein
MPILLFPQGPAQPGIDLANVIGDILPALGAASLADLDWCTAAELYNYADEANKRLGHRVGAWVERATQTLNALQTAANAPTGHVDTIHASFQGAALRAATAQELASFDATWNQTQASAPTRFSMDAGAPGTIVPYPLTTVQGTMAVIYHRFQPTIAQGASVAPIASPIQDYFGYSMLAEARRKESDAAMPEMADHFDERVALYEQILKHYFGEAQ